jgi:hypothetical protein
MGSADRGLEQILGLAFLDFFRPLSIRWINRLPIKLLCRSQASASSNNGQSVMPLPAAVRSRSA